MIEKLEEQWPDDDKRQDWLKTASGILTVAEDTGSKRTWEHEPGERTTHRSKHQVSQRVWNESKTAFPVVSSEIDGPTLPTRHWGRPQELPETQDPPIDRWNNEHDSRSIKSFRI